MVENYPWMDKTKNNQPPLQETILIIEDDTIDAKTCREGLTSEGFAITLESDPDQAYQRALSNRFEIILINTMAPGYSGLDWIGRFKKAGGTSEIIALVPTTHLSTAMQAMKEGAVDFLTKPVSSAELKIIVGRIAKHISMVRANLVTKHHVNAQSDFAGIVGDSPRMEQVYATLQRLAPTNGTALITGESGTGKETVARAIHQLSPRKQQPFFVCDCSSLLPNLLASELFGHVKGSFSEAVITKRGLFEVAHNGTLFLDEISSLSMEIQGTLLSVLETRSVRKVGDTAEQAIDVRLIAATNYDLRQMVKDGLFREDLFYRLNVVPIHLPPLRARTGDIPKLAATFLARLRQQNDKIRVTGFEPEAMQVLETYHWPGNIRELKNVIERLAILCDTEKILPHDLPNELEQEPPVDTSNPLPTTWEKFRYLKQQAQDAAVRKLERRFLIEALRRTDGNVSRAAEEIGMQRTNFHSMMRKYDLTARDFRELH